MLGAGRKLGLVGAVVAATSLIAGGALAQIDPRAPIDITADAQDIVNSECLSTWNGSVEALQGKTRLRADTVSLYSAKKGDGCGASERMEARGKVYFVTPERTARADEAVYVFSSETITLTGNVIVMQGKSVVRGDRMVINTRTGQANMTSTVKGRNKPGRVRGVFYPGDQGATR